MAENGNSKNGNYTAGQFIEVIPGSGGIITTIASRIGCAWHTAKRYITKYATVQQAYQDECAKVVDKAESVIIKSLQDDDVQTAKWYLTMKGAERGYKQTQHQEVSGPKGGPIETSDVGLSDSDRAERILAILDAARARGDRPPSGGDG